MRRPQVFFHRPVVSLHVLRGVLLVLRDVLLLPTLRFRALRIVEPSHHPVLLVHQIETRDNRGIPQEEPRAFRRGPAAGEDSASGRSPRSALTGTVVRRALTRAVVGSVLTRAVVGGARPLVGRVLALTRAGSTVGTARGVHRSGSASALRSRDPRRGRDLLEKSF